MAVHRPITGNRCIYEFQHPISGDDLTKSREWRYLGVVLTDDLCAQISRGCRVCLQRGPSEDDAGTAWWGEGCRDPITVTQRLPRSSRGPFGTFFTTMKLRQWLKGVCRYWRGRAAREDSSPHSHTSLLETGLSWHRQSSQGKFLFLRCNNLTGIDKMKYILESLSTPVRLDHDKNILSYECLNVAAEGLPLRMSVGHGSCYYWLPGLGSCGCVDCLCNPFSLPFPPEQRVT